jgi:hypothetical protein
MEIDTPKKAANGSNDAGAETAGGSSSKKRNNVPFQRVKADEVNRLPQAMRDNRFSGDRWGTYGEAANEKLGVVKGKGFRHEKTKKKRGTYRGGVLDMEVRSIKFDD